MKAMRDVWGDTLVSLGNTNPNLLVLDADLANSTKADKFAKMYPGRFLQMGIAEQNFVGTAVGLASVGDPVGQKDDSIGGVFLVILANFLIAQHQTRMNIGGAAGFNLLDRLPDGLSIRQTPRR